MNKKEEKWRMEGASYALRIVREKGIDGLEQDLKMRGALNIPLTLKSKDMEEMYYQLARRIMNSIREATGRYVALDAILETLEDIGLPEAAELLKEKVNENAR